MNRKSRFFGVPRVQSAIALCISATSSAWAQQNPTEITITAEPPILVSGFDGVTRQELPISVTSISNATLRDIGAQRVSDALRLDASVSDSYNLPAYWDKLSVRGFALDNRYNYRREGLPISAETIIAMDNKERLELLKGTSGVQSGISSPGGLVNYLVKRAPTSSGKNIRDVTLSYGPGDNRLVSADLGGRFGDGTDFGYRINLAHEDLNPYIRDTRGYRNLFALAMDWRINSSNRLEWEFEQSHYEQIGVNFYSVLGSDPNNGRFVLPATVDGTRNITRQPTSQPGVFDGLSGTVRLKHQLDDGWMWRTQYGTQRLRADDRLTYASGCSSTQTKSFCLAPMGNFQIHDFRSDNERRQTEAVHTELSGQADIGGLSHYIKFSVMRQRYIKQMPYTAADTLLGSTNSTNGGLTSPSGATQYWPNTNASDYSTEIAFNDHLSLSKATAAWLGLRHTQLNRSSIMTNGDGMVKDERGVTTPWLALSHQLDANYLIYTSYSEGLETQSAPSSNSYTNSGQPLPVLRSTQREVGLKNKHERAQWQVTWFDITRPATTDAGTCDTTASSCTRKIDGQAHHQGLELSAQNTLQRWSFGGSAMWLDAKRENATVQSALNGQRPINVPQYILRGMLEYHFASLTGLRSGLRLSREGERHVTNKDDGNLILPAWTTVDATTHYDTKANSVASTWTLAIHNLANKHYWRESPKEYGQYFLYPGAPRTVRATVQFHL
jgi:iron complex outermembrane recepter protein